MKKSTEFVFHGQKFVAISEMVDTYWGPENRVEIYTQDEQLVDRCQEAATTDMILDWWKEDQDEPLEAHHSQWHDWFNDGTDTSKPLSEGELPF